MKTLIAIIILIPIIIIIVLKLRSTTKEMLTWNENAGNTIDTTPSDDYYGVRVAISQDGSLIVVEGKDGKSYVYSLENGEWVERKFAKYDDLAAGSKGNVKMTRVKEGYILECGELKYLWDDIDKRWINISPVNDSDTGDEEIKL